MQTQFAGLLKSCFVYTTHKALTTWPNDYEFVPLLITVLKYTPLQNYKSTTISFYKNIIHTKNHITHSFTLCTEFLKKFCFLTWIFRIFLSMQFYRPLNFSESLKSLKSAWPIYLLYIYIYIYSWNLHFVILKLSEL